MDTKPVRLYYQIDYTATEIPKDAAYFHAQFRRVNPLPSKEVYTIVDGVKGKGHYVGTYQNDRVQKGRHQKGASKVRIFANGPTRDRNSCPLLVPRSLGAFSNTA